MIPIGLTLEEFIVQQNLIYDDSRVDAGKGL